MLLSSLCLFCLNASTTDEASERKTIFWGGSCLFSRYLLLFLWLLLLTLLNGYQLQRFSCLLNHQDIVGIYLNHHFLVHYYFTYILHVSFCSFLWLFPLFKLSILHHLIWLIYIWYILFIYFITVLCNENL